MDDSSVIVAGAGYLGEALADALFATGHGVLALTHSEGSASELRRHKPYPAMACDLRDRAAIDRLAHNTEEAGPGAFAVVHCASSGRGGPQAYRLVYLEGCQHIASAFNESRLIFTSSTSVYSQSGGEVVTEECPAEPTTETGRILREAEDFVLASNGIVARLAGIYGPGRSVLLRRFLDGEGAIDGLDDDAPGRHINQIHRDDIVSALVGLVTHDDQDAGQIYNLVDDAPLTQRELYTGLSTRFGNPVPPVRPPDQTRKRGWSDKRVSNKKLRALGWKPRFPTFFDALDGDPALIPSIAAQRDGTTGAQGDGTQ
ncbi:SDR family oxidoreductase [soil metagenome]